MAFDIAMIKATYARLAARVEVARKVTNKPLTASEKYCIPTFGMVQQPKFSTEEMIM